MDNKETRQMPIYVVGHAHLDPAWQWKWQEGSAEAKATLRSALDRMNEFPHFRFVCSSALLFRWIERFSPSMFEEIKQRIKEGRFIIVGGWHIQPDCNLASGEGYARQSLYAQRYFKEKFGVTASVGYNPDSFGHNLMFPQILKKSGMSYYIYQRPSEEQNPMNDKYLFNWFSPDGSSVMTYHLQQRNFLEKDFFNPDVSLEDLYDLIAQQNPISEKDGVPSLFFYGVCDHGGGPTIRDLKSLSAYEEENPDAELYYSSISDFFEAVKASGVTLPEHHDDLQHFGSGCYSAITEIKNAVRRGESELLAAEKYSILEGKLLNGPKRTEEFAEAWRNVCFLHFHDVLAGTATKVVYKDMQYISGMALNTAAVEENNALQSISWAIDTADDVEKGTPIVLFNPNGFPVDELIEVNTHGVSMTDSEGNTVPFQLVSIMRESSADKRKNVLFKAHVPALGYAVYYLKDTSRFGHEASKCAVVKNPNLRAALWRNYQNVHTQDGIDRFLDADTTVAKEEHATTYGGAVLENEIFRIEFEQHTGYIVSFKDKRTGKEIISDRAAVPVVVDEYYSDTWGMVYKYYTDFMARFSDATVTVTENGPVRATVKVVNTYNRSTLTQYFSLDAGSDRLKVLAFVDWHEKHKMLKLAWPLNLENPKMYYEIPYGVIERPCNKEEEPSLTWMAMKGDNGGYAILNDKTYGAHADGNILYHTIVRSPLFCDGGGPRSMDCAHNFSDQGCMEFSYELMPVGDSWAPVIQAAQQLNKPITNIVENWHKGSIKEKTYEGLTISQDNIMLSAFKYSEDGNGLVIRLYETDGKETPVTVSGDLLPVPLNVTFTPYSVNTYCLEDGADEWKEVLLTEYDL